MASQTFATVLVGTPPEVLAANATLSLDLAAARWREQRQAVEEQFDSVGGATTNRDWKNATPGQRAVLRQLRRIDEQYLLTALSNRGVLPAHGMPHDVLPLVTTTIGDLKKESKADDEGGEERRGGRKEAVEYPTRPLAIALREYAPGSQSVVNGTVYESAGLTLHWQRLPANLGAGADVQGLRWAWRCPACAACGTDEIRPDATCGRAGCDGLLEVRRYIEPSGFAVDLFADPTYAEDPTRPRPTTPAAWIRRRRPAATAGRPGAGLGPP